MVINFQRAGTTDAIVSVKADMVSPGDYQRFKMDMYKAYLFSHMIHISLWLKNSFDRNKFCGISRLILG